MSSLNEWINPEYLASEKIAELQNSFLKAEPFPFLSLREFLKDEKAQNLRVALLKEEFIQKDSDLFSFFQTADLSSSKNKLIKEFHEFLGSKEFANFISSITSEKLNAKALDVSASLYTSGDYLLCHDDLIEDRKIAYIFYLCENFEDEDGGRLCFFSEKGGQPHEVQKALSPKWNSLTFFKVSNKSFHSVEENFSQKERLAIGGWLH